jgi:cbb3-type cytochrome oxidase maturation protein
LSTLYIVVPLALLVAAGFVFAFFWAVRSGQYDDMDTPAMRVVLDDDEPAKRTGEAAPDADALTPNTTPRSGAS